MLAHGALLRKNIFSAEELIAIVTDYHNAGLSDEEVALMSFAQKISLDSQHIDDADITDLQSFGLSDEEILNVVLACTARNFFSKTLDALDAAPDEVYHELEPQLLKALILGRPFRQPST